MSSSELAGLSLSEGDKGQPTGHEQGMAASTHKATAAEARRNETRLRKLMTADNALCADCGSAIDFNSAWASINLGMFCCIQCSGVHRSLGTHLSKCRALRIDDWNDDWVDNMEKWGNATANAFWEARPPARRPMQPAGASASMGMTDFITAKYRNRVFAAAGEPEAWLLCCPLANGWSRHYHPESAGFYFSDGTETVWDMPAAAEPPEPVPPRWWAGHAGTLEKKSGGKAGESKMKLLQKWDSRYFVLPSSSAANTGELSYYKSADSFRQREEPLGTLHVTGAKLFVKEQKGGMVRFTVQTAERDLKMRAPATEWMDWATVLQPLTEAAAPDEGHSD